MSYINERQQMFDFPGIYKIQSTIKPERFYIGSAVSLWGRKRVHKTCLKSDKHSNKKLQNHYNKYGKDDLSFSVIKCCVPEELIVAEQYFLDEMQPWFNIAKIAGSLLGREVSEETRKKLSIAQTGKTCTEETKRKMSKAQIGENGHFYGKKHTEEAKRKMSESAIGRLCTDETRRKMSEAKTGENNPFYGRRHTPEMLEKLKRAKASRIPVKQMSANGVVLNEYNSISEAARCTNIHEGSISQSVRKNCKAGGFWWEFI